MKPPATSWRERCARLADCRPGEGRALFWSFSGFFLLLAGYYVLRPVREEMGVLIGPENLQWAFTLALAGMFATVPLYGWAAARLSRRHLLLAVFGCTALLLAAFQAWIAGGASLPAALALFVWISVFNLIVVSLFWTAMADSFGHAQARRLFGMIAAGGSTGALVGPTITALSVHAVGVHGLLLIAAALMMLSLLCILRVVGPTVRGDAGRPLGGSVFAGLSEVAGSPYLAMIALLVVLQSVVGTFVYFEQARLVKAAALAAESRTQLFAMLDLGVNVLALLLQAVVAGRLMQRLGVGITLAAVPLLLTVPLAALAAIPVLATVLCIQVISRAGGHGLMRPAREALFTAVEREPRYKAKNVIDTLLSRAGDAFAGWLHAIAGLATTGVALAAIPAVLILAWLGLQLGRSYLRQVAAQPGAGNPATLPSDAPETPAATR
ncbi:MAG TPA: MFS transporter [Candidatus Accumulibacter phosphatis]|nr:MAG: Major Facilitator Superfamily protein [Candidatus Accumulibacter sp. SK-11]HAY29878.1 MFS transporter [Accumulibacter sp.]HRL78453.1 MFS transporter [Candidatus Accumulibacter phosphatis]HRQ97361.1 MFS transporter [Candidatus Accumulibacter phosphatis]